MVSVNAGNTITFPAETGTNIGNYNTTLVCNANGAATANLLNGSSSPADGQAQNTLLIGAGDVGKAIVCAYTNTRKTVDLSILKSQSLTNGSFTTGTLKAPAVLNPMYFSLVVSNLSGATATNATYTDTVPTQFINPAVVSTSVGGTATCPAPSFSGSTLSGTATIPVGSSCTIIYSAVPNTLTSPTVGVINTATVAAASGVTDANTANNTSSVTTFINPVIRLNVVTVGTPPAGDSGFFNLSLANNLSPNANPTTAFPGGGTNPQTNQGNGGTTGWVMVDAGNNGSTYSTVTAAETAGTSTNLANYTSNLACVDGTGASYLTGFPGYPGGPIVAGNTSNGITAPQNPTSGSATQVTCTYTNTVRRSLTLTKAFSPTTVAANSTSRVTLTFNAAQQSDSVRMTDNLPAGLLIAPTPNVQLGTVSGTCYAAGAYYVATAGSTQFVITTNGGAAYFTPAGVCTLSFDVVAASAGSYVNTIPAGAIADSNGDTNPTAANATLTVTAQTTLQTAKLWGAGSPSSDVANVFGTTGGTSGGAASNTASFSTTGGTARNTAVVPVTVGDTLTFPAENFTPAASAANYTTVLACTAGGGATANALSGSNGQASNTLVIGAGDSGKAIVCTFTNTPKTATLQTAKLWGAGSPSSDVANVFGTTGGTSGGAASNTASFSTTGGTARNTAVVPVTVGDTLAFPAENFTPAASAANYTTGLVCTANGGPTANALSGSNGQANQTLLVGAGDSGKAIVCTYTNTPKLAVLNTTKVLQGINGALAAAGATVKAGDILDYQISVSNTGGSSGTTTLTDTVPANTTFSNAAPSLGWSCANGAPSGTACTQTVSVAAGATTLLGYRVTVLNPLPVGTTSIANSVTTSAGTCSSCTVSNPTASVLDTTKTLSKVNGAATTGTANVVGGDVFLYNITVRNNGGTTGTTVLTETVPAHTTYTGSGEGWSCANGSVAGTSCTLSVTLAPGTVVAPFTVTVDNPLPPGTTTVVNTVSTSAGTCSGCTVTTPGTNLVVSGHVFTDNGAGGGTPNDGLVNGGEAGVSSVRITLTNCIGTTYATTLTDASGNYLLGLSASLAIGAQLCVEETNPVSSVSTGASAGSTALPSGSAVTVSATSYTYTRTGTPDRIAFGWNGTGHSGLNFGDVGRNTFAADGAKTGQSGNTVVYPHTFTAQTGGSVSFGITSAVAAPTLSGWSEKIFADPLCTGAMPVAPAVPTLLFPPAVATTVTAGQQVCVIMQEFIPATALNGYINTVKVQADFTFTNAAPALTASYQVTDVTKVGSSALDLKKQVRNVTQSGVFGVNNQAKSGEMLEYQITYTNNGASAITNLTINDATPAYTTFLSALAGTTPATLTACQKQTPANALPAAAVVCPAAQSVGGTGAISFQFSGPLNPGATGTVLFRVTVN
ncbi:putative repeat protein (TIGR01451 family) [Variovorax sp. GrIS 2.14]|uniref:beta strand repeat-containing protein n=1 Tax=Variovorax sp. GrIS 2.14 TaxID=3071709 RepID=UPI0038F74711